MNASMESPRRPLREAESEISYRTREADNGEMIVDMPPPRSRAGSALAGPSAWFGRQYQYRIAVFVLLLGAAVALIVVSTLQNSKSNPNTPAWASPYPVDAETPKAAWEITNSDTDNVDAYRIMFSDEFNDNGRQFGAGQDERWEATNTYYADTQDFEAYVPDAITTKDGRLVITTKEMGNLELLRDVFLFENSLHGPIPSEFGRLTNVYWMDLRHNLLAGTIPHELAAVFGRSDSITQTFDFSDNYLNGYLPNWFGQRVNFDCDDTFMEPLSVCRVNRMEYRCPTLSGQQPTIVNVQTAKMCGSDDTSTVSGQIYFTPATNEQCFTFYAVHPLDENNNLLGNVLGEVVKTSRTDGFNPIIRVTFDAGDLPNADRIALVGKVQMGDVSPDEQEISRMVDAGALQSCSLSPSPSPTPSNSMSEFTAYVPGSSNRLEFTLTTLHTSTQLSDIPARRAFANALLDVVPDGGIMPQMVYVISANIINQKAGNKAQLQQVEIVLQSDDIDMLYVMNALEDNLPALDLAIDTRFTEEFGDSIALSVEMDSDAVISPSPSRQPRIVHDQGESQDSSQIVLGIGTAGAAGLVFFSVAIYLRGKKKLQEKHGSKIGQNYDHSQVSQGRHSHKQQPGMIL